MAGGKSQSFGQYVPKRKHLVQGRGVGGEVQDLREDIDDAFFQLESTGGISGTPTGYISGLVPSYSTAASINISPGVCRSDDASADLVVPSTLSASLASSGAGGLDTGSESADTWYSIWIIGGNGNPVRALLSIQQTSPTLPGTYSLKRRVGWIRNDGSSNIFVFLYVGDGRERFHSNAYRSKPTLQVFFGTQTTFTTVDCTAFLPPGARAFEAFCEVGGSVQDGFMEMKPGDGTQLATEGPWRFRVEAATIDRVYYPYLIASAAREMQYRVTASNISASMAMIGFYDTV